MKGDAELAATLIGAEQINQQAYGLTIVGFAGAAPSGGGSSSTKGDERRLSGGDVTADGKAVVESGGGGLAEVAVPSSPPSRPRGPEPDKQLPPVIKTYSEMAIRALAASNTSSSRSRSAEQGA
ncbi:hypothetical protein HFN65_31180 [Rhizobium laguerreae]|uniref:hypothetical protein n=1 Tax=Rhizobium laguerreae TaxID=1076926 RepID=UPI001C92566A|nr:hypothetical protein [Rhizobium laguerreae]MBY3575402.1 hypothetical protein [Rhizobium laguerreae]